MPRKPKRIASDTPYLLTKEQRDNPEIIFRQFFKESQLNDMRVKLVEILITTHSKSNRFNTEGRRADLRRFFTHVELFFEAAYVLAKVKKRQIKPVKTKYRKRQR